MLVVVAALAPTEARAQDPAGTARIDRLGVFLDCDACDFDHFRREAAFVDYVRDRNDAHVHVLVTTRRPGAGGREFTFDFIGLRDFEGQRHVVMFTSGPTDTDDEERNGLIRAFMAGLASFAANTAMADRLEVSVEQGEARPTQPVEDPWNYWSFRVGASGGLFLEQQTEEYSLNGSFTADRTTNDLRLRFFANGRFNEERFEFKEDSIAGTDTLQVTRTIVSTTKDFNFVGTSIHSIGESHWAAGGQVSARRSTRVNQDLAFRVRGALEYSIFPYEESTRKRLTIMGTVGLANFNYQEVTLFGYTKETRVELATEVSLEAVQPWGETGGSVVLRTFAEDLGQHRLQLFGFMRLRVVRGLDFSAFLNVARIKDQIYLPGGDIPPEDVLLRRRQLGTDFRANLSIGLSYRFGSVFNNIVNPRLEEF
jgi:hypothetical protein